jgi:hypothetical protein
MSDAIVEQIENGVQIRLRNGEILPAKPLSLPDGRKLVRLWLQATAELPSRPAALQDVPDGTKVKDLSDTQRAAWDAWTAARVRVLQQRVQASAEIDELFGPAVGLRAEDEAKLSHGAPLKLLQGFFWLENGEDVVRPTANGSSSPTGTTSIASTSPPSA